MKVFKIVAPVVCLAAVCLLADDRVERTAHETPVPPRTLPGPMDVVYAARGDLNFVYGATGENLAALTSTASATSTFSVTYNGFDPTSMAAFQAAVNIWSNVIASPAPIRIVANWTALGSGVLGSAGASLVCARTVGGTTSYYPTALADKLNGSAYCAALGSTDREITANFNSTFADWEFGTAGTPVAGKYNFMTVVMHEIGHGLGFFGSMSVSAGDNTGSFFSPPVIYDRFAITGGAAPLIGFVNPSLALASQLVSDNTFFNGANATSNNGGMNPKLETHHFTNFYGIPTPNSNGWRSGSSYSHVDDVAYTGTPNGMMTFQLNSAEVYTDPGPIVRGMFLDEGWGITPLPPTTFTLNVGKSGAGSGSVTSSPAGITCGGDCTQAYDVNTVVTLTATPVSGSAFAGWSGACSGTSTCQVTMSADRAVTATFTVIPLSAEDRIAIGLTPYSNQGGWLATRKGADLGYAAGPWTLLPYPAYDVTGGGLRVAAGDVDGDGLDEVVVGLGPGGQGWIAIFDDAAHGYALLKWLQVAWPTYNSANGEVWPAVGDLDGDGLAEIVAGLGAGGQGYFQIFNPANNYTAIVFRQVAWPAYNAGANGSTHPAVANVDGVGASEIVVGLGAGSAGWIEVFSGLSGGYSHQSWFQSTWASYNTSNGTTFPAAGDLDGDGRAEIVLGFGNGGAGWLEVFDDANAAYGHLFWLRTSWPAYNTSSSGETHPAVGNVDNDSRAEIVIGLGAYGTEGGWVEIRDDSVAGYASVSWQNTGWTAYKGSGGGTFPAVGKFK